MNIGTVLSRVGKRPMIPLIALVGLLVGAAPLFARSKTGLRPIFSSDLVTNGVTQSKAGRLFLPVQPRRPGEPRLIEARDGKPVPYPDATWNAAGPPDGHFIGVNAVRVGPDGALWVVDSGSPSIGKPSVPGAARLIRIDLATDKFDRIYDLAEAVKPRSFVDDVRFNGDRAYLTDSRQPGLIVLDLATGHARRVLDGDPSTTARGPIRAEGRVLRDAQGQPVFVHADQLEVSPDGRWLYFQPCDGGLSRIETRFLDDPAQAAELARHVQRVAATPTTGGTAIDASGTMYFSDTDRSRILTVSPEGKIATLIADPRLAWPDAMWISDRGELLMAASQLDRTAGLNGGRDAVRPPVVVYSLPLGLTPVRR